MQSDSITITYSEFDGYRELVPRASNFTISNFTAHTMTLNSAVLVTPQTAGYEIIKLKK